MRFFRHVGNSRLVFGDSAFETVPDYIDNQGPVLVITGRHFINSKAWKFLENQVTWVPLIRESIIGEPTPLMVDALTQIAREKRVARVLAIGGGSVLDAGKAVAAMVYHEGSVMQYLEGVGDRLPQNQTLPVIAVPTTAGTGSEATKNAVLSQQGKEGFKKSLRNDAFIPQTAIIDPTLALGCPPEVTLACGLDALCQLLESFISTEATPITDMLARDGLQRFGYGSILFTKNRYTHDDAISYRRELALASYYSGLTLANAGLGTVHGLAGPLGAVCGVPHGVACGLLLAPVFRRLVESLDNKTFHNTCYKRLAIAGAVLNRGLEAIPDENDVPKLIDTLYTWSFKLPRLSTYGLSAADVDVVVAASGNKNFPVPLDKDARKSALLEIF